MLTSVQFKNYRGFQDTGRVDLSKINLFIGANNAGKSSFTAAIELMLRSLRGVGQRGPLQFEEMSSFSSFDALLRKHWSPNEQRPKSFELNYSFNQNAKNGLEIGFECVEKAGDNTCEIKEITYKVGGSVTKLKASPSVSGREAYAIVGPRGGSAPAVDVFFQGIIPFPAERGAKEVRDLAFRLFDTGIQGERHDLEVIHPSRPVPRSFYVIDDPGLTLEDRNLLTYLIRIWSSDSASDRTIRERIVSNMSALGLTKNFEVSPISKKTGPKVFEIRVSPNNKRQTVTIADAGFGLSQVLPLIVYEARLNGGYLVGYQPELHLHPRAQSRLADIFVKSVERNNQVFIETHSPDLIMRLQLLIVQKKIRADDVSVFCFENAAGRSRIERIGFDDAGIPSRSWPEGFLDTSLTLARELNSARISLLSAAERTREKDTKKSTTARKNSVAVKKKSK